MKILAQLAACVVIASLTGQVTTPAAQGSDSAKLWGTLEPTASTIQLRNGQRHKSGANDVVRYFLSTAFTAADIGATTDQPDPTFGLDCGRMHPVYGQLSSTCFIAFRMSNDAGLRMTRMVGNALFEELKCASRHHVESGAIQIRVQDSLTGVANPGDSRARTELPVFMPLSDDPSTPSFVERTCGRDRSSLTATVRMVFGDKDGRLVMDGAIAQGFFEAKVSFANAVRHGRPPVEAASGDLGRTLIEACSAFRCR
jgi:hypothetical protein